MITFAREDIFDTPKGDLIKAILELQFDNDVLRLQNKRLQSDVERLEEDLKNWIEHANKLGNDYDYRECYKIKT